ncbi:MAG TPA: class I SAM-dependent methyltransferase [Desulfosporosinus sp.]|nr:class I SAM-dependent methyltransferase [Desulfosporosinus sp.]
MKRKDHWSNSFFGSLYLRFDQLRSENIGAYVSGIKHLCKIGTGTKIMELCCGYGRILIPLVAKTGATATGIDKSSTLLLAAEESAREQGVVIRWKKANVVNYRDGNSFDATYIAGTSLGYYENDQKNRNVLLSARSCLKKGGVLLLHQRNCPTDLDGGDEDGEFIYRRNGKFDKVSGLYVGSYGYHNKITGRTFTYPFRVMLYRRSQLVEWLAECGFGLFQCYGDLYGRPFREESPTLVIVCEAIASPLLKDRK